MPLLIRKVADRIYRGPQPVTTQHWQQLKILGIEVTLDLETGSHWIGDGDISLEQKTAAAYGITMISFPLGEVFAPTHDELSRALNNIVSSAWDYKIYVHCKTGVDRTGMVIGHYRTTIQGYTRKQAIQEMYDCGMHWWLKWWAWFLP